MAERTKLVVRHLPPSLPEEVFWKTLSRWLEPISQEDDPLGPPKSAAIFKEYLPGKPRRNKTKVEIPSRAYIQFASPDQVIEFHQGYASQAFRDSHGNLTFPKVEFAPYQKVAGPPKKIDNRIGTIDKDQEYRTFLERLNAPAPDNASNTKPDAAPEIIERPEITPLIEHLRNVRKAAQEAAMNAKQQRQAANSGKSSSGRSFAGQPQVMKRPTANTASNSQASLPPRKAGNPAPHDTPPHLLNSTQSSSKPVKQTTGKSSSTVSASTNQTPSTAPTNPSKSRSNKPSKSKKASRAAEDKSSHPSPTEPQGKSPAPTQPPKTILKPPKSSDPNTDKLSPMANKSLPRSPSKAGDTSGKKQGSPTPDQQVANQNGPAKVTKPTREGQAGSKKSSRGGKPGKPGNPPTNPSSSQPEPFSSTTLKASKSQETGKNEPNSIETAAARRRLGNALAGITSKADHPAKKKQNSKLGPSASTSSFKPPPTD